MDYVVKTEVFEGPFDLLLHLIARQRVDIWQVSLSRITEDYLAEVRRMRELNLEVATEFLVVAATLLELKAARLLPAPDADPDEIEAVLEERDLLFARVLQYRAYKQAAGLFGARLAEQTAYVPRRVGAEDLLRRIVPELLVGHQAVPIEVVIGLLAVLELYKLSLVELDQTSTFGDISIRWTGGDLAGPIDMTVIDITVEEPA
jgi:chromatin segregation and condensation protein Rec8/ScpA/Scc1 (kleisin family)